MFVAVQEITHPTPSVPAITILGSTMKADSDGTSEAGAKDGSSTSMRKKQVVSMKPVP